jgi:flagellar protein FlaG
MINPASNPSLNTSIRNSPSIDPQTQTQNIEPKSDTKQEQTPNNNQNQSDESKLKNEDVRKKIEESFNAVFDSMNTDVAFKFYQKSDEWYAVVEDKFTGKVVKEIPPKSILEMHAQLKSMIGFFLDKKV